MTKDIRFPFGNHQGQEVGDLIDKDPNYFSGWVWHFGLWFDNHKEAFEELWKERWPSVPLPTVSKYTK